MWRVSKNNNDSFTTEDLLNIINPIIPNYIEEFYTTHPVNLDMSKFVRFYNPEYYVNVIQINENTYRDLSGMLYRTDGSTYTIEYMATELYVWDYIKLPDGTIRRINENKTIRATKAKIIEYITGYTANTIIATPNTAIYNYNSHTHLIQPISTTATTLTLNVSNGITNLPDIPKTIKTLYLNNCPNIPLLKDSQIEKIICNVATPITLAETFQNCKNINEMSNVVCTGHIYSNWSNNSNACNLVEYTNLQNIDEYGFYNCVFTNKIITFDTLASVGSYGLYNVENLHVKSSGTVELNNNSISHCKNCIFEFAGSSSSDSNYNTMTDCCFTINNSSASTCANCVRCYIEIQNLTEITKNYGNSCNNCMFYFPNATTCSSAIGSSSTNLTILAPSLTTLNTEFYDSFNSSSNARLYLNGTLSENMTYKNNIEFAVLKTSAQRSAWSKYCGICIYTDTSYNTTTNGYNVFHKTIDFPTDNYYIGISFCNINNTRESIEGLAVLCQDVEVSDPNNKFPNNYFQHSNNCTITN